MTLKNLTSTIRSISRRYDSISNTTRSSYRPDTVYVYKKHDGHLKVSQHFYLSRNEIPTTHRIKIAYRHETHPTAIDESLSLSLSIPFFPFPCILVHRGTERINRSWQTRESNVWLHNRGLPRPTRPWLRGNRCATIG